MAHTVMIDTPWEGYVSLVYTLPKVAASPALHFYNWRCLWAHLLPARSVSSTLTVPEILRFLGKLWLVRCFGVRLVSRASTDPNIERTQAFPCGGSRTPEVILPLIPVSAIVGGGCLLWRYVRQLSEGKSDLVQLCGAKSD